MQAKKTINPFINYLSYAELGKGGGTSYPGAIDTNSTLEVNSPNSNKTKARAEVIQDAYSAILAIQRELGTDPAGTLDDVKTYLQTEHNTNGTHDNSIVALLEGAQTLQDKTLGTTSNPTADIITKGPWVDVRAYGADPSASASTNQTSIQNAIDNTSGDIILFFIDGTFQHTDTFTTGGKNVWFKGAGKDRTILELTQTGSSKHGINVTGSTSYLRITDMTIRTQSNLTSNLSMNAIRMDADTETSIPTGSELSVERVKITGYNIGVFAQGDTGGTGEIEKAIVRDCTISTNGASGDATQGPIRIHRSKYVTVENNDADANDSGDHGIYLLHDETVFVKNNRTRETQSGGIKIATEGAGQVAPLMWTIEDNDIFDDEGSSLIALTNSYDLPYLSLKGNSFRSIGHFSDNCALMVITNDTSRIRTAVLDHIAMKDVTRTGIIVQANSGTTIDYVSAKGLYFYNFSTDSSGTYRGMTTTGTGTISTVDVSGHFDGNNNGRAALQISVGDNIHYGQIVQQNCTAAQVYSFSKTGFKWNATATVSDGGTITHGAGTTPTAVIATPSVAGEMVSVTTIGATTFTVAIKQDDGTAGTSQTIYWIALN